MRVVLDPDAPRRQRQHVRGVWREYWVWPHPEHYIWGATAAILVRSGPTAAEAARSRKGLLDALVVSYGCRCDGGAGRSLLGAALLRAPALAQTRIDSINTNFRWLGPDDKIVVERYDDPRVQNVSCYCRAPRPAGSRAGWAWPRTRAGSRSRAGRSGR